MVLEVVIMVLKCDSVSKFRITRRIPEEYVVETMISYDKDEALRKFDEWLNA